MKYFVIAAILCIAVSATSPPLYSEEELAKVKGFSHECETSTHVAHDKLTDMRAGTFHDDPKLKDYLFCILKKMDWQHDDGTLDKDHIKKDLARSSTLSDAMSHCYDKHGSSGPETAYEVFKCYEHHLPTGFKHF